jgi:hypothetical protein
MEEMLGIIRRTRMTLAAAVTAALLGTGLLSAYPGQAAQAQGPPKATPSPTASLAIGKPAAVASGPQKAPANFSKLPASWHGYAPPARRAARGNRTAVVSQSANVCSNATTFYNRNSGAVVEVYDSQTTNGAIVDQWGYDGTQTQYWCSFITYYHNGTPVYELVNNNSGLCLDVPGSNFADGQHLQQWQCNGTNAQEWTFNDEAGGHAPYTTITTMGGAYAMEVYGSSFANGAEVDIWTGNGTSAQGWCAGEYCPSPSSTPLCVDIPNGSGDNRCVADWGNGANAAVLSYGLPGNAGQWLYTTSAGGTGEIISYYYRCLQVNAAGGDTVRSAPCDGDSAEMWTNEYDASSHRTFFISGYNPSLCLSADYNDSIAKADYCGGVPSWYQEWGTS